MIRLNSCAISLRLPTAIATVLGLTSALAFAAANPNVEQLRQLPSTWDADLSVALEGGKRSVSLGDTLRYHLNAGKDGVCYLIHVDTQGASSLMRPSDCSIVSTSGSYFPSSGNLEAAEPAGRETLFAVMLQQPSAAAEALLANSPGYVSIDDAALDKLVSDLSKASAKGQLDIAENSYMVGDGTLAMADTDLQYTTRGIIRKVVADTEVEEDLDQVTQEISFDVQSIRFEFGSDQLAPEGIRQLNEFGAAMQAPELESLKLRVAGHTDDQGDSTYNLDLSERRAATVANYLEREFQIPAGRLEITGMGENAPLIPDTTLEARAQNRRVEMVFVTQ